MTIVQWTEGQQAIINSGWKHAAGWLPPATGEWVASGFSSALVPIPVPITVPIPITTSITIPIAVTKPPGNHQLRISTNPIPRKQQNNNEAKPPQTSMKTNLYNCRHENLTEGKRKTENKTTKKERAASRELRGWHPNTPSNKAVAVPVAIAPIAPPVIVAAPTPVVVPVAPSPVIPLPG